MNRKLQFTALGAALLALSWISWPARRFEDGDASLSSHSAAARGKNSHKGSSRENSRRARPPVAPAHRLFSSLSELVSKGDFAKLTPAQLEDYLAAHHRDANSLLAAHQLGNNEAYLREAQERFPNHPRVLLASTRQGADPAARLQSIEAFKRADPENALGNCTAAKVLLDLGNTEEAANEMLLAKGKVFDDFMLQSCQDTEEAYLSAGISPLEAKITALYSSTRPELIQLRNVTKELARQSADSTANGNDERAAALTALQVELARNLEGGGCVVDQLVGIVIEKEALRASDAPESLARLEQLDRQRTMLSSRASQISELMKNPEIPEGDWSLYFDRAKLFGESAANVWMLEKHVPSSK